MHLMGIMRKDRNMSNLEYGRERGFAAISLHRRVGGFLSHCCFQEQGTQAKFNLVINNMVG